MSHDDSHCRSPLTNYLYDWYTPGALPCVNTTLLASWPRRLAWSRTPAFHADNTGSNPVGVIFVTHSYDAILLVSFGGPEKPADVIPFLQNVLRGKNVPHERMLAVAEHYYHFGGKSPINDQNRLLIRALQAELDRHGPKLPVYWGNRNWHPFLPDTLAEMMRDGVQRALVFVTSPYGSYSSCRQYLENLAAAQELLGPSAPRLEKLRGYFNHPRFIAAQVDRTVKALSGIPSQRLSVARLVYTAHSIPIAMAENGP